ncbi:hypothetical protein Zmor_024491 [Zophobas morio]|uniref:Integrase catalytic domain-containing protein n=1 Tax=Zophobas morio TaxID=2755281 RepID=A0AA38I540_9CUCU|nr:hypothetical protein Zmor_024491 [Zophobas morio]
MNKTPNTNKRRRGRPPQKQNVLITDTKREVVDEIFKPARKTFPRRHTVIKGLDDLWQIDLADLRSYSSENSGYKYILVVIDCFSKFLWTKSLKTKGAEEGVQAMEFIFKRSRRHPRNLQSDQGKEFYNNRFNKLMQKYKVNHYSTYSVKKAAIAERVIRTIKSKLFPLLTLNASYRWLNHLERVTSEYNSSIHRTTGKKPIEINKSNKGEIKVFNRGQKIVLKNKKFLPGDFVRISKEKLLFEKGYTPNWSTEIFKVVRIKQTNPVTYLLEDSDGRPIKGSFYNYELQKTKYSDVYLIEKVVRRKGGKIFVKWLGLPQEKNSWINLTDIM